MSHWTTSFLCRLQRRLQAFGYALAGWWHMRTQPHAWVHGTATLAVLALGAWLGLPARDWAVILLAVGLVWVAEMVNTAIESAVDMAGPGFHPLAKTAKDVAAGAVLAAALVAAGIGLLVLGPPLWARWFSRP